MPVSAHRQELKLTLRVYADRDADLFEWLAGLERLPYGRKGEAIKDVLRQGLGVNDSAAGPDELLPQIRAVVEAAVTAALADASLASAPAAPATDSAENDALLDALSEGVLL